MTPVRGPLGWRHYDASLNLLFATRLVSQTGQALFFAWLYRASGSGAEGASQVGGAVIAMMLASILLGIPGGTLADRFGPPWALPIASVLRLTAVVAGFLLLSGALWLLAFTYSVASQVFSPAELALVRTVGQRGVLASHAALLVLQYVGFALGALLLFPLLSATDHSPEVPLVTVVLLVVTVATSAVLGARLSGRPSTAPAPLTTNAFVEVLSFFRDDRRSLYAAGALSFSDMATRSLLLALPLYLLAELELTTPGIVALLAVAAAGGVAGLVWVGHQRARASQDGLLRILRAAMVVVIACSLALAILADALRLTFSYSQLPSLPEVRSMPTLNVVVALPVFAALGAVFTATPIASRALLSARAPLSYQGRAFAAQGTLSNLLVLLPLTVATVGADLIGSRGTLAFVAVTGGLVLLVLERFRRVSTTRERAGRSTTIR
jgi:hypothetical protein